MLLVVIMKIYRCTKTHYQPPYFKSGLPKNFLQVFATWKFKFSKNYNLKETTITHMALWANLVNLHNIRKVTVYSNNIKYAF